MICATNGRAAAAAPNDDGVSRASAGHENEFSLSLELESGFAQSVDFGIPGVEPLIVDEFPPLGAGAGPNPARLLGAAVGSCLAASLHFCMRKSRLDVRGIRTSVKGTLARNDRGRLRIDGFRVRLEPILPADQHDRVPRCLALFEDFCTVTASVRGGLSVDVEVVPESA